MESVYNFIKRKNKQFEHEKKQSKLIRMKDIGRKGQFFFQRENWVFLPQTNLNKKVFVLERLRKIKYLGKLAYRGWKRNDIEYRIGYFIVGKIRKAKNRWVWGQYCPIIPHGDLLRLFQEAKKRKVLL